MSFRRTAWEAAGRKLVHWPRCSCLCRRIVVLQAGAVLRTAACGFNLPVFARQKPCAHRWLITRSPLPVFTLPRVAHGGDGPAGGGAAAAAAAGGNQGGAAAAGSRGGAAQSVSASRRTGSAEMQQEVGVLRQRAL